VRRGNGEGAVYRDSERGGWVGQLYIDGRRRKVRAKTKTEVLAKLAALKRADLLGVVAVDGNATLGQVLELWRERVIANRDLAPSSIENYDWALRILRAELGGVRLRTLDVARIEKAIDHIATGEVGRGNPVSRRTLKLMRSTLSQALDLAVRRKMVAYNPARMVELTPTAVRTEHRRALAPDQAAQLWDVLAHERLGNLVKLMLTTGLRPGEALGLCWDAVDLDAGLLTVRRAVRLERGRSRLVDELKTAAAYRTIAQPAPAVDVLRAQRRDVAALKLAARVWPLDDRDLVYPTVNGTTWNLANVRHELARICDDAGLPRLRPHELRHTAASVLSDQGVPLEHIADLLGHVDVTMVSQTYRHRVRPSVDAAVDVMDRLFGG
jgi:integrase